jgi:integrase/recombinase XerD
MRALRRVYEVMGAAVPAWSPIKRRPPPAMALLRDYAAHLGQHRGNPEGTIHKKLDHVGKLLEHLARRGKSWRQMRLTDVDAFLIECARRYARSTTADIASTVRSFARFLLASGRPRRRGRRGDRSGATPVRTTAACLAMGRGSATAAGSGHQHGAWSA